MTHLRQNWLEILAEFANQYNKSLTSKDIAKNTNISKRTVARKLNQLLKLNILKHKTIGKSKLFSLNFSNPKTKQAIRLTETYKAFKFSQKNKKIGLLLLKLGEINPTILFGSYAKGYHTSKSDIDLLVLGRKSKKIKEITETSTKEINIHYSTPNGFKKLIKKRQALALEIIKNHVIFGNIAEFFNICWDYYEKQN